MVETELTDGTLAEAGECYTGERIKAGTEDNDGDESD